MIFMFKNNIRMINQIQKFTFKFNEPFFSKYKGLKFKLKKNHYRTLKEYNRKETSLIKEIPGLKEKAIDVAIIGGGILGSSLYYLLAKHTNIKNVVFFESITKNFKKLPRIDQVIHTGEIESNFDLEKSIKLRKFAKMLINCATNLPDELFKKCIYKKNKILIGIGEKECNIIENRYENFKYFNPNIRLINKREIGLLEPCLVFNDRLRNYRQGEMNGMLIENEYTCINYNSLSQILLKIVEKNIRNNKINQFLKGQINSIERVSSNGEIYYKIINNDKIYFSKFLVLNEIDNYLKIIQKLGYCLDWGFLNLIGKHYYSDRSLLNGVVYSLQDSNSLFKAICGFPDIESKNKTKFSLIYLPLLTNNKYKSLFEFLKLFDLNIELLTTYLNLKNQSKIENIENVVLEIPFSKKTIFTKNCKKIIPSIDSKELKFDTGFEVKIKQLVDLNKKEVIFEENKVNTDENLIININQSISGTTCIGSASNDMVRICHKLGANMNEESFNKEIMN